MYKLLTVIIVFSLAFSGFGDDPPAAPETEIPNTTNLNPASPDVKSAAPSGNQKYNPSNLPKSFDWTVQQPSMLPQPQDQKNCNSTFAMAVTVAVSCQNFIASNSQKADALSAQQIVDCSKDGQNKGCAGGSVEDALKYVKTNGLTCDSAYQYVGKKNDQNCETFTATVNISSYTKLPTDDASLELAIANGGPAVASFYLPDNFKDTYKKGQVFGSGQNDRCQDFTNYAGVIVGFDATDSNNVHWIVRISTDLDKVTDGIIFIAAGKCGIGMEVYQPVIDTSGGTGSGNGGTSK